MPINPPQLHNTRVVRLRCWINHPCLYEASSQQIDPTNTENNAEEYYSKSRSKLNFKQSLCGNWYSLVEVFEPQLLCSPGLMVRGSALPSGGHHAARGPQLPTLHANTHTHTHVFIHNHYSPIVMSFTYGQRAAMWEPPLHTKVKD